MKNKKWGTLMYTDRFTDGMLVTDHQGCMDAADDVNL